MYAICGNYTQEHLDIGIIKNSLLREPAQLTSFKMQPVSHSLMFEKDCISGHLHVLAWSFICKMRIFCSIQHLLMELAAFTWQTGLRDVPKHIVTQPSIQQRYHYKHITLKDVSRGTLLSHT